MEPDPPPPSSPGGHAPLAGERAGHSISFDRIAADYDATRGGEERGACHAALVAPHLDPGLPVLDVGVGTGAVAMSLARAGFRVRGVDLSPRMLRRARERLGAAVVCADAANLPFADGSIPQACSVWVLHLVGDVAGVMTEVARVLRPGGRWVVVPAGGAPEPGDDDPITRLTADLERRLHGGVEPGPRPSPARLAGLAGPAGLIVEALHPAPRALHEESPAQHALNLERRVYSMCWDLDDDGYTREVAPVVAALRALPDPERPLPVSTPHEVVVVLRRRG